MKVIMKLNYGGLKSGKIYELTGKVLDYVINKGYGMVYEFEERPKEETIEEKPVVKRKPRKKKA